MDIPARIGRYEVKSLLGRGGMATVYRAYDPLFKREVAIKVLPRELLHDPSFRARFDREAETIAALEHPAIVPVYDFGEEDGQPYIVMRVMRGGSLEDRIRSGALTPAETARILSSLAPALDRAHAQGVVHRDLKPSNILFDGDGNPYLGDFGIARLTQSASAVTATGLIGTPAYMSPEQARGERDLDGRSDIYALGAITYQMLSGQLPYESDTPMGMAVKHITEPVPDLARIRPDLPPDLARLVDRAMAKRRDDRYRSAAQLVADLTTVANGGTLAPRTGQVTERSSGRQAAPPTVAGTLLSSGSGATISGPPPDHTLIAEPPGPGPFTPGLEGARPRRPLMLAGVLGALGLCGVVGLGTLALLARSAWPLGAAGGRTATAPITAASPAATTPPAATATTRPPTATPTLAPSDTPGPTPVPAMATLPVRRGDRIVYACAVDGVWGICAVDLQTLAVTRVVLRAGDPALSPIDAVVAAPVHADGDADIYLIDLDAKEGENLTDITQSSINEGWPAWSPDGQWIVYSAYEADDTRLMVMRRDGSEARLLTDVTGAQEVGGAWSPDGKTIAFNSDRTGAWEIWLIDADGSTPPTQLTTVDDPTGQSWPSWSPDGSMIVFECPGDRGRDVCVTDLDGNVTNLTDRPGNDAAPAWSPDGRQIAFISDREGVNALFLMNADGSSVERLIDDGSEQWGPSWPPNP